jgi:hypothetical protein
MFLDITGNREQVAGIARNWIAKLLDFQNRIQMLFRVLAFQHEHHILQVSQSVWLEVWKEDCVVIVLEQIAKAKGIKRQLFALFGIKLITRNHIMVPVVVRLKKSNINVLTAHSLSIVFKEFL